VRLWKRTVWPAILWIGLVLTLVSCQAASLSSEHFELVTPEGKSVAVSWPASNQTAVVFVFIAIDCPICQKYAPELNRLAGDFKARAVDFWFVFPDPDLSSETLKKAIMDLPLNGHVALDRKQKLAKFCDAQVTPEAVVMNKAGVIVYRGRIDDRFPALSKERQAHERTLQLALDQLLSRKDVEFQNRRAIGCQIPSLK